MTYLLIFLIGCLWITRDIIRVPENFNDSWFKRFKGNKFIDPQVSWVNKGNMNTFLYFIIVPFSDLFHLLGTLILCCFFYALWMTGFFTLMIVLFFGVCFLLFGAGVWLFYQLWRKLLNPK